MTVRALTASLLISLATGLPVCAQGLPAATQDAAVTTPGGQIAYTATWSELVLKDQYGPQATISTISYVRKGTQPGPRPVIFIFNGGPGASSLALNYGLFGPELKVTEGAAPYAEPIDTRPDGTSVPTRFVPNPDTLLDVADLVMIDPVGTGFSRELRPIGGQPYWSVAGDAAAAEASIRSWLAEHGRLQSPVFLAGESYGGFRIGQLAPALTDLDLAGLILISPGLDLSTMDGDLGYAANVPAMAVAAAFHGRVARAGRSTAEIHREAQAFVDGEYVAALHRGNALPEADRRRIAARLARLTGLSAETILAANLRIDTQAFLDSLLPGKVVGRLDDRALGEAPKSRRVDRDAAADDPSLGLAGSNVRVSRPVTDHLRAMGVQVPLDYVSLSLDVNFRWDWRPRSPAYDTNLRLDATPGLRTFLLARPQARMFVATGYHDLTIPLEGVRYTLNHGGIAPGRFDFREYVSGHSIGDDPAARPQLLRDLRTFVSAAARP